MQPVHVESSSITVKCPPHNSVEERESYIEKHVKAAVHQRLNEIHHAPHRGALQVSVTSSENLNTSVASADSDPSVAPLERSESYANAINTERPMGI
mmetsp:Transcript_30994/g.81135  ORF Transcript_30994/g.81135 Transcript_30994/m.81135 type:complete len:97 (+) Transcript_30994:85-375(+)|eukprot:CAMPEP_0182924598 /NCGR_PEP_ID=MMETSP0105_2-20130417/6776_1 /TAXON_ID=81532 ORGANISM="Acanthoeca-like sp., Strain 10tr" /NCGR_SAMPLE_ID=MMETSP0105_2 /ASSEMBLY_ACC=CAM_ASM_000205 /LENGTH=96 /DNA_ID=CAMNT_0025062393 /DNA_START=53 /DNA_END=343 /DNA_ORIENTATION=-